MAKRLSGTIADEKRKMKKLKNKEQQVPKKERQLREEKKKKTGEEVEVKEG